MTTKNTYQLLLKAVQSLWNIHTNSSWRLCKVYEKYTPPPFEDCAKSIKNTYQLLLKTMQSLWKIHTNSSWRLCKVYEKYIPTLLDGCAKFMKNTYKLFLKAVQSLYRQLWQGSRIHLFTVYFTMPSKTFTIQYLVVGWLQALERIWKEVITEYYVTW